MAIKSNKAIKISQKHLLGIQNLSIKLIDRAIFKKVLRFGFPLVFAGISWNVFIQ